MSANCGRTVTVRSHAFCGKVFHSQGTAIVVTMLLGGSSCATLGMPFGPTCFRVSTMHHGGVGCDRRGGKFLEYDERRKHR